MNKSTASLAGADEEAARRQLSSMPGFTPERARNARITRLIGLTNRVYKIDVGGDRFCLRIPGAGAAAIIDRRVEAANARAAAQAGVAPQVLFFGPDGVMLTRFVDGEPLLPERLKESAGALTRLAAALRRLHNTAPAFSRNFEPFAIIDSYVAVLEQRGVLLSDRQRGILGELRGAREALNARPPAAKPCHCDTTGRNLLDTGERVWLVDWEYSGMNDPMWDLAYFSIQSALDVQQDADFLSAYLKRPAHAEEAARMETLKAPVELLSTLWALIQDNSGNQAADFAGYAARMFEHVGERMRTRGILASR